MTLQGFVDKYLGKKVDWDNFYGGQCVDLYRQYVHEVLGYPQSPPVRGAANIWDTVDTKYYEKINNDPDAVPEPGDIVIWNTNAGGGYGHVAIFLDGDVNSFTSLDQNWPTLSKVTKTKHNYSNIIGWLRPKEKPMAEGMIELPSKTFEELVGKSSRLDAIRTTIGTDSATEIKKDYDEYKATISQKNEEIRNERERADLARKELNNVVREASIALNTVQEPTQVIAALKKVKPDLERIEDLERTVAELQLSAGKEKESLLEEIARLKALVQHGDISQLTLEELLGEIIKRLKAIIRRQS